MKLGLLYKGPNQMWQPTNSEVVNSHIFSLFNHLYPNEIAGTISIENPDFSMMRQFDTLLYIAMPPWDEFVIAYAKDIPCVFVVNPDGAPEWTFRNTYQAMTNIINIMSEADIVIVPDHRKDFISAIVAIAGDKVRPWLFPIPVKSILEQLTIEKEKPVYDIIIPYGPYRAQQENRGGYAAAIAAQRIVDTYTNFNNYALLNWVLPDHVDFEEVCQKNDAVLRALGCKDFTLLPVEEWRKVLRMYKSAKLVINLDWTPAIGRVAAECALLGVPYVGTDLPNLGHYIYGDVLTVSPFDIDSIVALASLVNENKWPDMWLREAHDKALRLALPIKADEFERIVKGASCG